MKNVVLIKRNSLREDNIRFRSFANTPQLKYLGLDNSIESMKQLFVDLQRYTSATVISRAGGVAFARKGKQWNNSVLLLADLVVGKKKS